MQLSSSTPLREKFLVGPSNEHLYVLGMIEAAVVYKGATTTERYHLARNLNEQLPGSGIIEKLELLGIKLFSLSLELLRRVSDLPVKHNIHALLQQFIANIGEIEHHFAIRPMP